MPAYKDKKNGSWYVKYKFRNWRGEEKYITKRGFATKGAASRWERENKDKTYGTLDMTVESYTQKYLEDLKDRVRNSTLVNKEFMIRKHIIPYLGKIKVNKLTTEDVLRWQNAMLEENEGAKFKKSYLKTLHNQLSAMLNHAIRYYGLASNPAALVGNMGSDKEVEIDFITLEEYQKLAEAMMDEPMYYVIIEILYYGGLREGEMLALTLDDINFKTNEITVSKTYYILKGKEYIGAPKTNKSNRTVKMPEFVIQDIRDYAKRIYGLESTDRLFPINKSQVSRHLDNGLKKAGLRHIRVHDLRHSHVSLLIDLGYSAVAIAERLGHESVHVTFRYAHLFPSVQKEMADKLDELGGNSND